MRNGTIHADATGLRRCNVITSAALLVAVVGTTAVTGCRAETYDIGPSRANVEPAHVYPSDVAIATRRGNRVPPEMGGATTQPAIPNQSAEDEKVVLIPPASQPSNDGRFTSDGAVYDPNYDGQVPAASSYFGAYDRGEPYDAYAGGYPYSSLDSYQADRGTNQYNAYGADYWFDRGYWAATPYYYGNYVRYGSGYGYPYSRVDGRTYVYRDWHDGDRHDPRRFERDWNERAKYRDRYDRQPRIPYPFTDSDRDGNGIDDRIDDGRQRPVRDAGQAYRDRQREDRADPRAVDARNEQLRRADEQRARYDARRTTVQDDIDARRSANRDAAERAADSPRSRTVPDAIQQPSRRVDPIQGTRGRDASEGIRRSEPPRDAPRQPAPTRDAGAARSGDSGRPAGNGPARSESGGGNQRGGPTRDAGAARNNR